MTSRFGQLSQTFDRKLKELEERTRRQNIKELGVEKARKVEEELKEIEKTMNRLPVPEKVVSLPTPVAPSKPTKRRKTKATEKTTHKKKNNEVNVKSSNKFVKNLRIYHEEGGVVHKLKIHPKEALVLKITQ